MKEIVVEPMRCVIISEGLMKIDRIGAGVGIIIYNSPYKVAAGMHVLRTLAQGMNVTNPMYYADTVIPYALEQLKQMGAHPPYAVAVAGGSVMMDMPAQHDIGSKLFSKVRELLTQVHLNPKLEETGGSKIRTMLLDVHAGKIKIV